MKLLLDVKAGCVACNGIGWINNGSERCTVCNEAPIVRIGCTECLTKCENPDVDGLCPVCGGEYDEVVSCPFCGRDIFREAIEAPVDYCHHDTVVLKEYVKAALEDE